LLFSPGPRRYYILITVGSTVKGAGEEFFLFLQPLFLVDLAAPSQFNHRSVPRQGDSE